ncbi:hypothetical protein L596_001826 [Steinernema carpocapsae]|uniref:Uncharacterized protein n=1 Tax=Steinernema carpocapsae TaxID=34508 RepID=A0A4U8UQ26_STECR|nr:hypothetical protein L596_001826 [Steinernema carpocapsae]
MKRRASLKQKKPSFTHQIYFKKIYSRLRSRAPSPPAPLARILKNRNTKLVTIGPGPSQKCLESRKKYAAKIAKFKVNLEKSLPGAARRPPLQPGQVAPKPKKTVKKKVMKKK